MLGLFKKTPKKYSLPFQADMHSHLLPGIDDGVKTAKETVYILKILKDLGYKKIITTPHIMSDYYPNTEDAILEKLEETRAFITKHDLNIELEAAAEYYLDESLLNRISAQEKLLTFGDSYILFETSFLNKPVFLEEAVFNLNAQGYRPVFAHPERYNYLIDNQKLLEKLKSMDLLFQMNILSLTGYYSPDVKKLALLLLKMNMIDFIGTDCHNALQANEIAENIPHKALKLMRTCNFLNTTLL